jgi:eukaryotic-like serine/threonine-protein kinase
MNPERWQRIKQICQSALEREASARGAFLESACGGDAQLRREVESLLANESRADHFIEESALVVAAQQLAAEPATITSGCTLGPYQIVSLLSKGGMGEVYRARDARLGRDVAVKVLPAVYASDGDRWSRFEQEARVAGVLNHPNIVTIHDIGTHEGSPAIIFELLEGETLRERLRAATPSSLDLNDALQYALQTARGLAAAHQKGIAHRDLKPENLFVTDDGRVKILDFGLAKLTEPKVTVELQQTVGTIPPVSGAGVILGTVGYMAPEQVRGQPSDHRADIFAFGVVLYEMIAGQQPFRGASAVEVMNAILKEEPRPLAEVSNILPPALDRVVSRCLRKDPGERFQSMREVTAALESLSENPETAELAAPPGSALRSPLWPHSSGSGGGRPGTDIRRRVASRSWSPCFRVPTAHRASRRTGA